VRTFDALSAPSDGHLIEMPSAQQFYEYCSHQD
jgi:hypothetical protein